MWFIYWIFMSKDYAEKYLCKINAYKLIDKLTYTYL